MDISNRILLCFGIFTGEFVRGTRTYVFPQAYTSLPTVIRSGCYKNEGTSSTCFNGVKEINLTNFTFNALETTFVMYDLYTAIGF